METNFEINTLEKISAEPKNRKKIYIFSAVSILIIITVLLIMGISILKTIKNQQAIITQETSKTKSEEYTLDLYKYKNIINDGQIIFIKESKIYILDTNTMETMNLKLENMEHFENLFISKNGQYLFTNSYLNNKYNIVIYDLINKKIKTIIDAAPEKIGGVPRVVETSKNNDYFIVLTACCPGDVGYTIFDYEGTERKKLTGGALLLSPDESQFIISKSEFSSSIISIGPEIRNNSIYLEKIDSNNVFEKLLTKATSQTSFMPVGWTDDKTIVYQQLIYLKPFPNNDNYEIRDEQSQQEWEEVRINPTVKFYKLNINTLKSKEITGYDANKTNNTNSSPNGKWKIISEKDSIKDNIFIFNKENNIKIKLDAQEALWIPISS